MELLFWADLVVQEFAADCICDRIASTREMCDLLKNFAHCVKDRVDQSEQLFQCLILEWTYIY